ncbi:MAG: LytR C-terminal domain-containing protein [Ignavibacteriales bacterium]|nr:LytR C-terminal domain-containing protein [Ignavibacteriales bacterium]MCF8307148.1 LytR C-terminal domain-containing protein [Ignavibacteriales bacterium]MCF8316806.1 LytR C-terminal domain-containing protein [Ignavibacteriales bacterium]MCF8438382.1 LytR C-terminal domain-containing protein [Ignavibacteriales bacterium]
MIKFVSDPEPVITKVAGQEPSEIIQIEVLNGSGIDGVAARVTDFLRNNGFDVVKTGNYMTSDIDETMIIDRSGNEANARKTAKILGVPENTILVQTNRDYFLDVSVIIGKDYFKLTPIK